MSEWCLEVGSEGLMLPSSGLLSTREYHGAGREQSRDLNPRPVGLEGGFKTSLLCSPLVCWPHMNVSKDSPG